MTGHRIDQEDSQVFARLSGDFNRQHLDTIQARRLPFGGTVVHGVHIVCHALNDIIGNAPTARRLQKLRVSFTSPLRQDAEFSLRTNHSGASTQIFVENSFSQFCSIVAEWSDSLIFPADSTSLNEPFTPAEAERLDATDLSGVTGEIRLRLDDELAASLFPALLRSIGRDQLSSILATTLMVGMHCPGDRSIFKYLSLTFNPDVAFSPCLIYSAMRYDPKSALLSLSLQNSAVKGNVHSILRALPVVQPHYDELRALVPPDQFAGQTVLVVGGSRGIGEVAAKLAAAGGARVIITYARGEDDAVRVAGEIVASGGSAQALHADVTRQYPITAASFEFSGVTHVYYFATPKIDFYSSAQIHRPLLETYLDYYVFGLERLLAQLAEVGDIVNRGLTLFLPSTIFISEPKAGAFEYAGAKAIAEVFAQYSSAKLGFPITPFIPQLPMTRTDQTSSVDQELPQTSKILLDLLPKTKLSSRDGDAFWPTAAPLS